MTPLLTRRFGLVQATAPNMIDMVGAGPFIIIPPLTREAHRQVCGVRNATESMFRLLMAVLIVCAVQGHALAQGARTELTQGWHIQSSAKVKAGGARISTPAFRPTGWYRTSIPATVLAALVENKVYRDPFFSTNLRSIPGTSYPIGKNFSNLDMPADSPFRVSWWYRTTFTVPSSAPGRRLALHFDGINYRANIWLNGRKIAGSDDVAGTYRVYEFDVTRAAKPGAENVLAVEVFPPGPDDLAWTWVDWNPAPPDKNMGVWRLVYLTTSGEVTVRHLHVASHVAPGLDEASLTVSAEVHNQAQKPVHGVLRGRIERIVFEQRVELAAGETKVVRFAPEQFAQLRVARPRLWWPAELGPQNLYRLDMEFRVGASISDEQRLRFGIREATSELTEKGGRLFKINGQPLLIRGGGWAPDMLLRPNPERQDAEMRYVRDMHLNTIRLEGKLEDERFFDLADEQGILVMPGWCCCDQWEKWADWKPENRSIAAASQRDQICRLRTHPSVFVWLNGSDNPPPADIEQMYIDILTELDWPNPFVSSATQKPSTVTGPSGVKMTGPYDWVPPSYWLLDESDGGAHGFNTETSPGPAVPPIESLRRMLPRDHLWPIDDVWNYHAGGGQFKTLQLFTDALNARYGAATSVEDYALKSQLMAYEGERAMFEAYARNQYTSTGVIQWMLNNAWPSMIWHLYDYYLRPGGGYFGTKKACEPLHVQYSYDDRSVVVVNTTRQAQAVKVIARVLNLDLTEKFSQEMPVEMAPGSVQRAFEIPADLKDLSPTYFVDLRLVSSGGAAGTPPTPGPGRNLSSNFYWLSTAPEELDWEKGTWYATPVKTYADFTALNGLAPASVRTAMTVSRQGATGRAHVTLTNTGQSVAFFIRLQIVRAANGEEVLPVLWEDNYVTLLPGETRTITATYGEKDLGGSQPRLVVSGWNTRPRGK